MSIQAKNGRGAAGSMALALLTVLALLVAPVCAPLCAAKICASNAPQEKCHDMAAMGADNGQTHLASSKSCRAFEFPALIEKADETVSFLRGAKSPLPTALTTCIPQDSATSNSVNANMSPGQWSSARTLFEVSDSFLVTTVLRI